MAGEKLTRFVDEQVMQSGCELDALGQAEILAHTLEHWNERPRPPGPVDRDQALRDLPGIADSRIEAGSILQPVAGRTGDCCQSTRVGMADRERNPPDALHLAA